MPSLFTLPGPRSGPDNFFAEYDLSYGEAYGVTSGVTLYASLPRMFWGDYNYPLFTNNGTIWNISSSNISAIVAGFYIPSVTNTGMMITQGTNGGATAISVGSSGQSVDNSGSIYAIASGIATGIEHWDPDVRITNTGLIASYAPSGPAGGVQAIGVAMYNGGVLTNGASGSILAEGVTADAIIFGRGSLFGDDVIQNDGHIEALSTTPGQPSYAILAGGVATEILKLVNNGLIKADVAWSSYSSNQAYAPTGIDVLTNNAGGTIIGRIETGGGDDSVFNSGSITGDVALGEGNDVFDTSAGTWSGAADLGWGDDQFFGSAATDVVQGNRGNDQLSGNGGNDLLLGGIGDDLLVGGAGNDGLYGELGNDRIVELGGDRIDGGDGNDRIELSDYSFASVDGGNGYDTLVLPAGARLIDLSAVVASGRVSHIEEIDLGGSKEMVVRASDVAAITGGATQLVIGASSSDKVDLVGSWNSAGSQIVNGLQFDVYTSGGSTVLVQQGGTVVVGATAPAGATGLDAIASGAAAPAAGSLPGGDLSNPVQNISWYYLTGEIDVTLGETWQATNASVIYGESLTYGLVNAGLIQSTNNATDQSFETITHDVAYIVNSGTIRGTVTGPGAVEAIDIRGTLQNSGTVQATADTGQAIAAEVGNSGGPSLPGPVLDNEGTISAYSSTGSAIGARVDYAYPFQSGPLSVNDGHIQAIGGAGTIAFAALTGGLSVNDGTIVAQNTSASGANDATAVQLYNGDPFEAMNQFINHGSVSGVVAIRSDGGVTEIVNTGRITGAIQLGDGADTITNSGLIQGAVTLGDGNDVFDGSAGTQIGAVDGGMGNDALSGGAGADTLTGGAGIDTLTGGAGNDTFIDTGAGLSGDTITDFHTGDRIIITDATLAGFTFSLSGSTLTYTGGSVTLSNRPHGTITAAAAAGGGVQLTIVEHPANDFNGDGRSDVLWRNDNGQLVDWLGVASGGFSGNGPHSSSTVAADWQVAGTGDFNGDGRSDILWRSTSTGGIADWLGTSNGGFAGNGANSTSSIATAWQVAGIGDFNGDGRSDILWRNPTTGQIADWLGTANGGFAGNGAHSANAISIAWAVAGIGDFNGDGFSDILWRNTTTGRIADWLGTPNGGFTGNGANSGSGVSASWRVAGIGDFNGDGHSDILWLNPTTGQVTDWLGTANGGFADNSTHASITVSTDWQVAAIGDDNGDGIDDILWRSTTTGNVTDWLGRADGGFTDNSAHAAALVDMHWHSQPVAHLF